MRVRGEKSTGGSRRLTRSSRVERLVTAARYLTQAVVWDVAAGAHRPWFDPGGTVCLLLVHGAEVRLFSRSCCG